MHHRQKCFDHSMIAFRLDETAKIRSNSNASRFAIKSIGLKQKAIFHFIIITIKR